MKSESLASSGALFLPSITVCILQLKKIDTSKMPIYNNF